MQHICEKGNSNGQLVDNVHRFKAQSITEYALFAIELHNKRLNWF